MVGGSLPRETKRWQESLGSKAAVMGRWGDGTGTSGAVVGLAAFTDRKSLIGMGWPAKPPTRAGLIPPRTELNSRRFSRSGQSQSQRPNQQQKSTGSSAVERLVYTQLVGGSNPSPCMFEHVWTAVAKSGLTSSF